MAQSKSKNAQSSIRIIGGEWRGRKLPVLDEDGLRPTQDRVRETVFNWLSFHLAGAQAVDLFAGTGALGLEALSRGAGAVAFVDTNRRAVQALTQNLTLLKDKNGQVHCSTAQQWLSQQADNSIDLVFMDPPFGKGLCQELLSSDALLRVLKPGAKIYVEREKSVILSTPFQLLKEKSTGSLTYSLFECTLPSVKSDSLQSLD